MFNNEAAKNAFYLAHPNALIGYASGEGSALCPINSLAPLLGIGFESRQQKIELKIAAQKAIGEMENPRGSVDESVVFSILEQCIKWFKLTAKNFRLIIYMAFGSEIITAFDKELKLVPQDPEIKVLSLFYVPGHYEPIFSLDEPEHNPKKIKFAILQILWDELDPQKRYPRCYSDASLRQILEAYKILEGNNPPARPAEHQRIIDDAEKRLAGILLPDPLLPVLKPLFERNKPAVGFSAASAFVNLGAPMLPPPALLPASAAAASCSSPAPTPPPPTTVSAQVPLPTLLPTTALPPSDSLVAERAAIEELFNRRNQCPVERLIILVTKNMSSGSQHTLGVVFADQVSALKAEEILFKNNIISTQAGNSSGRKHHSLLRPKGLLYIAISFKQMEKIKQIVADPAAGNVELCRHIGLPIMGRSEIAGDNVYLTATHPSKSFSFFSSSSIFSCKVCGETFVGESGRIKSIAQRGKSP